MKTNQLPSLWQIAQHHPLIALFWLTLGIYSAIGVVQEWKRAFRPPPSRKIHWKPKKKVGGPL